MSWKKSPLYFAWQAVSKSQNFAHFQKIWANHARFNVSLAPGHNSVADESAWLNYEALDLLDQTLTHEHRVFEYGGGGSTLFFCKRAGFVATVEHDKEWFEILQKNIRTKGYTNWQGVHIPPVTVSDGKHIDPANPADFGSASPEFGAHQFKAYAKAITSYPVNSFDVVLVDGRARPSCIQESMPYLKSGGLLIIDNAERQYYRSTFQAIFSENFEVVLDRFFPVSYTPDFTITMVLRKK